MEREDQEVNGTGREASAGSSKEVVALALHRGSVPDDLDFRSANLTLHSHQLGKKMSRLANASCPRIPIAGSLNVGRMSFTSSRPLQLQGAALRWLRKDSSHCLWSTGRVRHRPLSLQRASTTPTFHIANRCLVGITS